MKSQKQKRTFPLSKVYGLLESGPVVMLSTSHKGKANVMSMSWHTMMEFEPPLVGCVVSERNFSFKALKTTKQCVLSIPTFEIVETVIKCGSSSGREIDKFDAYGLTPVPASQVSAPLVGECYANLECRVVDTRLVQKYNFFILEVIKAWVDRSKKAPKTIRHCGQGNFMIGGKTVKLSSKVK